MTLILKALDPPGDERELQSTASLTIGRGSDNDWVLEDPSREVSKIHCRIEPDGDGHVLVDLSINGVHIDGASHPMGPGSRHQLTAGDIFNIGHYRFAVVGKAQGVQPYDFGSGTGHDLSLVPGDVVPLSISQILAGGSEGAESRAAGAIAGEAANWLGTLPKGTATENLMTPLGWVEPPVTTHSLLPAESDQTSSELANRSEHAAAPSGVLRLPRVRQLLPMNWMEDSEQAVAETARPIGGEATHLPEASRQIAEAAQIPRAILAGVEGADFPRRVGEILRIIFNGLEELESAQAQAEQHCGILPPAGEKRVADGLASEREPLAALLGDPTSEAMADLRQRIARLAMRQVALGRSVADAAADWDRKLAPDAINSALAHRRRFRAFTKAAAWTDYIRRYDVMNRTDPASGSRGILAMVQQVYSRNTAKR